MHSLLHSLRLAQPLGNECMKICSVTMQPVFTSMLRGSILPPCSLQTLSFSTSTLHFQRLPREESGLPTPKKPTFWERVNTRENRTVALIATIVGGYWLASDIYKQIYSEKEDIYHVHDDPRLPERPPNSDISHQRANKNDKSRLKLTLYQYQTCPFCSKLRAFLDYYGFDYDIIEVNSVTRTQTSWSKYRKVPFLVVEVPSSDPNQPLIYQLKDSSVVMSMLSSLLTNPDEDIPTLVGAFPARIIGKNKLDFTNRYAVMSKFEETISTSQVQKINKEIQWRKWIDDHFVHIISPNVYRTWDEALQTFKWFSEAGEWDRVFPSWERFLVIYVGALAMYFIAKRLKKRHHIADDPRSSLYDAANEWMTEVKRCKGSFVGGDSPNLADISMYGMLTAMEGCEAFADMTQNTKIGPWFYAMKKLVQERKGEELLIKRFH